jgi:ABC-type dipeptide/oligopeptide/nickel transport system permease subunit
VIVAATLSVPYYILGEVVLSFLGVGIQEPSASWGLMLNAAQNTEYLRIIRGCSRPARRFLSPFWLSTSSAMD